MVTIQPELVKVKYYSSDVGATGRPYTYYTAEPLAVGQMVEVPVGEPPVQKTAIVVEIDVSDSEIAAFRDRVKTIPAGSKIKSTKFTPRPDPDAWRTGEEEIRTEPIEDQEPAMPKAVPGEDWKETIPLLSEGEGASAPLGTGATSDEPELEPDTAVKLRPGEDLIVRGHYQEARRMLQYAEARVIKTVEDAKLATDDLSLIQKIKKAMDDKRKEYIAPADKALKEIRATYTFLMAPILQAEKITKEKQTAFLKEQAEIKRKQEEINLKRMQAAEEEMKLNQELSQPVELIPEIVVPERIRTDLGTSGLTDHWVYEVIDMALLPDIYKLVNNGLLNDHARKHHDKQPIPGVRFYNEPFLATRARKNKED